MDCVFLFAHQDDEFGVYAQILRELDEGNRVRCIYLTDGSGTSETSLRDAESLSALTFFGIETGDVIVPPVPARAQDVNLHKQCLAVLEWLAALPAWKQARRIYVPAWEGGHPDHDMTHVIGFLAAPRGATVLQFPLYRARRLLPFTFRVMAPLAANGPKVRERLSWPRRLTALHLPWRYPSQWKTWIVLYIPYCLVVLRGGFWTQPTSLDRISDRPHSGRLLYEQRKFADWSSISSAVDKCIAWKKAT